MDSLPVLQVEVQVAERLDEFYKIASALAFTLLGLWWVVIQLRYQNGQGTEAERRHAYGVLLLFLLPGLMSLLSLVDDSEEWWRVVFGIIAALGFAEVALYYAARAGEMTDTAKALRVVSAAVYGLILLVAVFPDAGIEMGLGLEGLELEALLIGALFVIGIHHVFLAITSKPT